MEKTMRKRKLPNTDSVEELARFWDSRSGEPLGRPVSAGRTISELSFSPDGKSLYVVGDWSLQQWDLSWLQESPSPSALLARAEATPPVWSKKRWPSPIS